MTKGRGKGSKASTDGDGPGFSSALGVVVCGGVAWHFWELIDTSSAVVGDFSVAGGAAAETVLEGAAVESTHAARAESGRPPSLST